MNLSDVFSAVAYKKLVAVDIPNLINNQHELNGIAALCDFFGTTEPSRGNIQWHYFADNQDVISDTGQWTFYDARANHPTRTEWRFYYTGEFLANAAPDDEIILARAKDGELYGLVFQQNSAWLRAAQILFSFSDATQNARVVPETQLDTQTVEFVRGRIIEELGLEITAPPAPNDTELVLNKFGEKKFPPTKEMSAFARSVCDADPTQPDETLTAWIQREESLFRALEKIEVEKRLAVGFNDVEDFVSYSLSVQNRRKSRMGHALQNHLAALFDAHRLRYTAQGKTESNNKPDFLFPGSEEYHDPKFEAALLVMLGVKSSCKDRWRQVLTEADRIPEKKLCTLEAAISEKQTDEMSRQNLTLVLPALLHATYNANQRKVLLTLAEFIALVEINQTGTRP